MITTLAEVLALALAIVASPFAVIPAILLLFTPRPFHTGGSFLFGWITGVLAVTVVFAALASVLESRDYPPVWASWTRLVLGAALVLYGLKQWFGRGADTEAPAWIATIATADSRAALRLGMLLSAANPKVLLLAAAGGLEIGAADLTTVGTAVTALGFTLIASLSAALPLLAYAVIGERVLRPLGRARDWLERNNAAIMAVVITAIGVMLVSAGLSGI